MYDIVLCHFITCIYLYNSHQNQDKEQFHHQKEALPSFKSLYNLQQHCLKQRHTQRTTSKNPLHREPHPKKEISFASANKHNLETHQEKENVCYLSIFFFFLFFLYVLRFVVSITINFNCPFSASRATFSHHFRADVLMTNSHSSDSLENDLISPEGYLIGHRCLEHCNRFSNVRKVLFFHAFFNTFFLQFSKIKLQLVLT